MVVLGPVVANDHCLFTWIHNTTPCKTRCICSEFYLNVFRVAMARTLASPWETSNAGFLPSKRRPHGSGRKIDFPSRWLCVLHLQTSELRVRLMRRWRTSQQTSAAFLHLNSEDRMCSVREMNFHFFYPTVEVCDSLGGCQSRLFQTDEVA